MPVAASLLLFWYATTLALVCGPKSPSAGVIRNADCSTLTAAPLDPTLSTTLSYAAYLPVVRLAPALRPRQTGEVTMPVAASLLLFWYATTLALVWGPN